MPFLSSKQIRKLHPSVCGSFSTLSLPFNTHNATSGIAGEEAAGLSLIIYTQTALYSIIKNVRLSLSHLFLPSPVAQPTLNRDPPLSAPRVESWDGG